jgi:hypothetical protein
MDGGTRTSGLRVLILSGAAAAVAPLVFFGIIAFRKVAPRVQVKTRHWTKRLQKEIARWT